MASVVVQLNSNTDSLVQNDVYTFDALVEHDGVLFGFSSDGAFKVAGETNNGEDVDAFFVLPPTDFGVANQKALRSILVQYESLGVLRISVTNDEDYTMNKPLPNTRGRQSGTKVPCPRDSRGVNHSVKIENKNGCYFAIDSIDVLTIVQVNKIGLPSINR